MQTKIDNTFKSKVFKAAGKIFAKRFKNKTAENWSKALKRAWAWAKETLLAPSVNGHAYNIWSPKDGLVRFYFSDRSYVQKVAVRPSSSYDLHRFSKGETIYKTTATAGIAESVADQFDWYV